MADAKKNRVILHLDMDAFFAAVEQMDNPQYRGKPVVVGADPKGGTGRGVVSTCSYEARTFGIHSAMPISVAYKRCPHAIFLPVRGKRYAELSRQIMAILEEFSPLIEQISIDEAFVDISGTEKVLGPPEIVANNIKQCIKERTGLTASIGIAPNKFVAKIASDLQKPDGLVIVKPGTVEEFLSPLEISRLWGVGDKTRPHLEKMGIKTIGDITKFSCEEMAKRFGKHGRHLWNLAHGRDDREVVAYTKVKSVSNEVTFEHDTADLELMQKTILQLSEKVASRLRKKQLMGNTVTLKIRLEGFTTFTRNRTLKDPVNTSEGIYSAAFALFKQFDRSGKRVRLLGVGVSALKTAHGAQMSLFAEQKQDESKIDTVMDKVRDKFGDKSIFRASLLRRKPDLNE